MITAGSLAAFSAAPAAARRPPGMPAGSVVPVREQVPAAPVRALPGTKLPGPPQPGQKLPRGSLLDLQI